MKNVILALLIVFAAQPVQASFCSGDIDMADMKMAMDHVMQQTTDADCCDHTDSDSSQSCDSQAVCSSASSAAAVLAAGIDLETVFVIGLLPSFSSGALTPSFDSPLYRPPIS
jgi:hypothetical protein